MANTLTIRIKDLMISVLQLYAEAESTLGFEVDTKRAAEEIAHQAIQQYMKFVKMEKPEPFLDKVRVRIMAGVDAAARLDKDPWDSCRTENVRVTFAYSIARILDEEAGDRHKFSVWSGSILGVKGHGNRGVPCIVAAPSAKAAVSYLNKAVPHARESLSWFRDHWAGGGNTGNKLATKLGVWLGKKKGNTDVVEDYELIWEPK